MSVVLALGGIMIMELFLQFVNVVQKMSPQPQSTQQEVVYKLTKCKFLHLRAVPLRLSPQD